VQLKQQNFESLNDLNKVIEDINHLDLIFSTIQGDTEELLKEARDNYFSSLNKLEVPVYKYNKLQYCFFLYLNIIFFRNCY